MAKVAVGLRVIRPELDRLAKCADGRFQFTLLFQGNAGVAVGFGKVGSQGDGLAIRGDGIIRLARRVVRLAEI